MMTPQVAIRDMPKLQSPFKRHMIEGKYVVTPEIEEGYAWVFDDPEVMAIEKLDGTNVSIIIEDGVIKQIWNRMNRVMVGGLPVAVNANYKYIIEGVLEASNRGYCNLLDGQHFGELIGPKYGKSPLGGPNPYKLDKHIWIPFETYAREYLRFKSWGKYPKDFNTISAWFEKDLIPLYFNRTHKKEDNLIPSIEGIVFTHPDGRMAKLRRDMYSWHLGDSHGD